MSEEWAPNVRSTRWDRTGFLSGDRRDERLLCNRVKECTLVSGAAGRGEHDPDGACVIVRVCGAGERALFGQQKKSS